MIHPVLFIILAAVAVVAALGMLLSRNAVHSALYLVVNFMTVAVFYLLLNAPFIAMTQIIVYAGAIIVLFLFVIMLLGADRLRGVSGVAEEFLGSERYHRYGAILLALVLVGVFAYLLLQGAVGSTDLGPLTDASPQALGIELFQSYVFPFEVTGVILLAAIVGVVIFGRTKSRRKSDA
ncbi:MAG TPA: NADH-quinone oxidoreductase subunit J [Promineifilum sp.]